MIEKKTTAHSVVDDVELVERLRGTGLKGPLWESVRSDLARYGYVVIKSWITSGNIYRECKKKGILLASTSCRPAREDSEDLAVMTVAHALNTFQDRTFDEWRPETGTALRTWFVGTCIITFPNVWRTWVRSAHRGLVEVSVDPHHLREITLVLVDGHEATTIERSFYSELLAGMPRETRAIVFLKMRGYRHDEIAEILDLPSGRSIEARLYRWRRKFQEEE